MDQIKDARSGVSAENLQEIMDAAVSAGHALDKGQQQYPSPEWLARACAALLPWSHHDNVYDPQCAGGNLLRAVSARERYGSEIDRRFIEEDKPTEQNNYGFGVAQIMRITGNCVHVIETMDELYKGVRFGCIATNPPFGIRWKLKDGETIDSTEWTWKMILARLAHSGCGFLISNAKTIERMGIQDHPWVYYYQRLPAGGIWDNCDVELGIVHFCNVDPASISHHKKVWDHLPTEQEIAALRQEVRVGYYRPWGYGAILHSWQQLTKIIKEEALDRPKWNIYLGKDGCLKTYLSTLDIVKSGGCLCLLKFQSQNTQTCSGLVSKKAHQISAGSGLVPGSPMAMGV